MAEDTAEPLTDAIRVDQGQLRGHIDEVLRPSVEETLNGLLQAEADQICGATRYEDRRTGSTRERGTTQMIEKRAAPPKGVQRFERKLGRAVAVGDDRRVDLSFSSEQPVARWFGNEVLSHAPGAVDLSRIASGDAPLLWNHNINAVISTGRALLAVKAAQSCASLTRPRRSASST